MNTSINKIQVQLVLGLVCLGFSPQSAVQATVDLNTQVTGTLIVDSQVGWYNGITAPPVN